MPTGENVILQTDDFASYKKLADHYYHYACNHSKADYAHQDVLPEKLGGGEIEVTINRMERDWGELKSLTLHHMQRVRWNSIIDIHL